jgi:hypothetical protein
MIMKINEIYSGIDQIYGKPYKMCIINAIELSDYLKSNIDDINDYIIRGNYINSSPGDFKEIYEYQNFFLIKKDNEYILLDGFRRLLVFDVPNININVRIYDYNDFNNKEILNLLINLNQTKFITNLGFYYDRGVCLAFDKLFGIKIKKFYNALDGYLRHREIKRSYSINSANNELLIDRILNNMFILDMKFIQTISENTDVLINDIFGVLVYNFRLDNPNKLLSVNDFITLIKNDESINELDIKVKKYGDDGSAKSQDVVNKLTESYNKIFNILSGNEVELTYNEKIIEFKKELELFKKNKNYIKLTKNRDCFIAERIILENFKKNKPNNYKLFVHPVKKDDYRIGYGLTDYKIELVPNESKKMHNYQDFDLYIILEDEKVKIRHGYSNYGRGQTYLTFSLFGKSLHNIHYDIELFVDIPQKEFKRAKINQYGK